MPMQFDIIKRPPFLSFPIAEKTVRFFFLLEEPVERYWQADMEGPRYPDREEAEKCGLNVSTTRHDVYHVIVLGADGSNEIKSLDVKVRLRYALAGMPVINAGDVLAVKRTGSGKNTNYSIVNEGKYGSFASALQWYYGEYPA